MENKLPRIKLMKFSKYEKVNKALKRNQGQLIYGNILKHKMLYSEDCLSPIGKKAKQSTNWKWREGRLSTEEQHSDMNKLESFFFQSDPLKMDWVQNKIFLIKILPDKTLISGKKKLPLAIQDTKRIFQ